MLNLWIFDEQQQAQLAQFKVSEEKWPRPSKR